MTREFLGLRIRNFQGIIFAQIRTYAEIFKSAIVYLLRQRIYMPKWEPSLTHNYKSADDKGVLVVEISCFVIYFENLFYFI